MGIVVLWVLLSLAAGIIAENKGRSILGFFLLALVFSPVIGIIAALAATGNTVKIEQAAVDAGASKKCPYCAELIKAEAIVCKHCGRDLVSPAPVG